MLPNPLHLLALGFLLASRFPNQVDAQEGRRAPRQGGRGFQELLLGAEARSRPNPSKFLDCLCQTVR